MSEEQDLTRGQKVVLKRIQSMDKPGRKELWKIDTIQELYSSYDSFGHALSTLEGGKYKLLESETGKQGAKKYSLSDRGKRKLRKIVQRERRNVEDEIEVYDYSNAVDVFTQYWEEAGKEALNHVMAGSSTALLDYHKLERHDPELADDLLDNPEEVLTAAEEAITSYPDVSGNVEIRVQNIPEIEVKEIRELSPRKDRNKLITVEGVLEATTEPKGELVSGVFECVQCGSRYRKEQDGPKPKSPYKCECGSRKFEVADLDYETVVMARLKDKPGKTSRKTLSVKIAGELAEDRDKNIDSTGQGIRVTGYIELYKAKRNSDHLNLRMVANNLEIEDDKWSDIELSDEDEEEIQEFYESFDELEDLRKALVHSIAKDRIAGMELMKESFLVWFLGRDEDTNIHVLVIGEPGLGKSDLANHIEDNYPRVIKSVGTGSTGVGLTAAVRKDELTGDYVAEAGAVAQAHRGYHITDEVDKTDKEDLSKLNDALSDKSITLSKANIHTEIPADVSEFALGNPESAVFDPYEPIFKQVPIQKQDLLERFDLKIALKREDLQNNKEDQEKILDMILGRSKGQDAGAAEDGLLSTDSLINYIAKAQKIDPEITEEVAERMKEIYFELNDVNGDTEKDSKTLFGPRRFSTLKKLSRAYARMDFSETVEVEHLKMATHFLRSCYETLDFEIGKDSFDDVDTARNMAHSKVREFVDDKVSDSEPEDEQEFIEKAVEELSYEEDTVEEVLSQLKDDGVIYQAKPGKIQRI